MGMGKLTVLYNDQCPVCALEIGHYRGLSLKRNLALEFEPISEMGEMLTSTKMTADEAKKRLYVRLPSGEVRSGVDAFLAIWDTLPGYRILGKLVAMPGLYGFSGWLYDRCLAPLLYAWDQRRNRLKQH